MNFRTTFHTSPQRGRNRVAITGALLLALLAGCSGGDKKAADNAADNAASPAGEDGANPRRKQREGSEAIAVETRAAEIGPITATLSFNSSLETEATVDLYPQISGQVESLLVEEGDLVKAGDALLKIDEAQLTVDAKETEVNLQREEAQLARIKSLFERGLVNEQEFENARFTTQQMRLRAERAKIQLSYATVRAPFDGVISAREVQVGARVATGTKLFSLVSRQDMVARVFVPGRYLAIVQADQGARITSEFLPGKKFPGWVKRISPVIDPQSGTFKVTVGLKDPDLIARPGLFVRVEIITEQRPDALLIPKKAVVYEGGERYFFTVKDDSALRHVLKPGFEDPDVIEVLAELSVGEKVIVLGQSGLKDGAKVKVVDPEGNAVADAALVPAAPVKS